MDFTTNSKSVVNYSKSGDSAQFVFPIAKNNLQTLASQVSCPLPHEKTIPLFIYPFQNTLDKFQDEQRKISTSKSNYNEIAHNAAGFSNYNESPLLLPNTIILPTLQTTAEDFNRVCCSPESGFGSEHQYSPMDSHKMAQMETPLNHNVAISVPNTSVTNSTSKNSDDFFPQIISVTSLAKDDKKCKQTSNTNPKNVEQTSSTTPLYNHNSKKRLRLDINSHNKTTLQLDIDSIKELNSTDVSCEHQKTNVKLCKTLPTSGKPQLDYPENIVRGLPALSFCKTLLRHKSVINDNIQVFDFKETFKHPGKVIPSHQTSAPAINTRSMKVTSANAKPNAPPSQKSSPPPSKLSISDNISLKKDNSCYDKYNGAQVQHPESNIILPKTMSTSATKPNTKEKCTPRSEKIKRLKEILKKREEALEVVRRDCGFID